MQCGHVVAEVFLQDQDFKDLYNADYFFGGEYSDYLADRQVHEKNFRARLAVLDRFVSHKHRSMLEIGSAYGIFLSLARFRFERVMGVDVCSPGVSYTRDQLGLDARSEDFLEMEVGKDAFDVVCMWDTIEHLREPQQYIKRAADLLPVGGLLSLTTGDIDSIMARLRKKHWRLIHPPTHVHYFSRSTLHRLLEDNGLEVVYDRYCGFYRSIGFAAYRILDLKLGFRHLYRSLRRFNIEKRFFYSNLYDIMYVIARKR